MNIKENCINIKNEINELIRKNDVSSNVTICAATKYVDSEKIKTLLECGINNIGENKVNDFLTKYEVLKDRDVIWHFIGSLQTNKVNKIINKIDFIHSLDRDSLASSINKYANKTINCFVQVNCSNESSKHGLLPQDLKSFILSLSKYDNIKVVGLMTMAQHTNDELIIKRTFQLLKSLQKDMKNLNLSYAPCDNLSMGMSNDYSIAILEGATYIRVGSKLFK